jgi:hypothetical protein
MAKSIGELDAEKNIGVCEGRNKMIWVGKEEIYETCCVDRTEE